MRSGAGTGEHAKSFPRNMRSSSEPSEAPPAECASHLKGRDKVGSLEKSQLADLVNDRGDLWIGRSLC